MAQLAVASWEYSSLASLVKFLEHRFPKCGELHSGGPRNKWGYKRKEKISKNTQTSSIFRLAKDCRFRRTGLMNVHVLRRFEASREGKVEAAATGNAGGVFCQTSVESLCDTLVGHYSTSRI
jgi:hypothetical protein